MNDHDHDPDAFDDFVELVALMRQSQNDYFRTGDRTTLALARDWERRVDKAISARVARTRPQTRTLPGMED